MSKFSPSGYSCIKYTRLIGVAKSAKQNILAQREKDITELKASHKRQLAKPWGWFWARSEDEHNRDIINIQYSYRGIEKRIDTILNMLAPDSEDMYVSFETQQILFNWCTKSLFTKE